MTRSARRATVVGTLLIALAGCASAPSAPRSLGGDVLEITRRTAPTAARADAARVDVELEAAAYCGREGKALLVLDSRSAAPEPPAYPTATVQFRCVAR